jgi:hypothetical protein
MKFFIFITKSSEVIVCTPPISNRAFTLSPSDKLVNHPCIYHATADQLSAPNTPFDWLICGLVYQALFCFSCAIVQSVSQAMFCEMGAKKRPGWPLGVSTFCVPYRAKRVAWKARCSSIKVLMKK